MDAAGKDGVIKHVMSGVNPQGCEVHSFKAPSAEELEHDFLWRVSGPAASAAASASSTARITKKCWWCACIPRCWQRQKLPPQLTGKNIWKHRFKDIRAFERHLARNGTLVLKFHLRISREEQRKRFLARLDEPGKRWKFSMGDVAERKHWDEYMDAYEDMIRATSTGRCALVRRARPTTSTSPGSWSRRRSSRRWKGSISISEGRRQGARGAEDGRARAQGRGWRRKAKSKR